MNWRWPFAAAVAMLLLTIAPAGAVEPYLEYVRALRNRDFHDYALLYLDQLEQRRDVPAEVREVISYEKALTLLDGARSLRNPEIRGKQLDQARVLLEAFLKASPEHAKAGQANNELALVYKEKGKVEAQQSKSPGNASQKAAFQKKARAYFADARKVFQEAHDRFKAEHDKFDPFIPKTDKARYEAREQAYANWVQAQFHLAQLTFDEAQTYDKGSAENQKLLTEASKAFEQIHARHRSVVAGLHARMWQGKCFEEQDDITKALGIYDELLDHARGSEKPGPALKNLQDHVLHFKLICLNHEKRKDYQVAAQLAGDWIKENRQTLSTRVGQGIQWELVRAEEMLGKKEGVGEAERQRMLQQALTTARSINRYAGEYKDASTAMIQRLMVALNREPGDPRDFPAAFGVAQNMVSDIRNRNKAIAEASAAEREKLLAEMQPILKEAARILQLALRLATPRDDIKDVNRARYFLSYIYFSLREYSYESAVLSDYVARKYYEKQPDLALDAAYLAQAAFIQAYNHEPEADRDSEVERIIGVCNFIAEHWPESDKAHEARMNLGALFNGRRQPAEAAKWYLQVPESASNYLEAQLAAGNAFWSAYLFESIRPEAERKPAAELAELLQQARGLLQQAIARYESQLPKEIGQVEPARLAKLTEAKLTYAQMLNGSGDYKGALALLTDGPLAVVAAVAAPAGDESQRPPKPGIRCREFASFAHQQILRAYVGAQNLDQARAEMKELEKIEGAGGGGAALTRIYLELGKELEKEVKRLQAAQDARLGEVLKSFETFLDDMSQRKDGQDYASLMWVAETYRALGDGLEEGDAAKAVGYFEKAGAALQLILDEEKTRPGYIPEGGLTGVQLRKAMALRRQKAFTEARKVVISILKEHPRALDAQEEAAQLYQDWAARGQPGDRTKWALAIDGDQRSKKKAEKDRIIWGWSGIAQRLDSSMTQGQDTTPEFQRQYLTARYNVAWCRFQDALSQSKSKDRNELLELAKADLLVTARLNSDLGGTESWEKFNHLYREIQQKLVDAGLQKGDIANLEKRSPGESSVSKARSTAARRRKAAARGTSKEQSIADSKPSNSSGSSSLGWILLGLVALGGGGAGAYFVFFSGRSRRRVYEQAAPDIGLAELSKKSSSTKTRR